MSEDFFIPVLFAVEFKMVELQYYLSTRFSADLDFYKCLIKGNKSLEMSGILGVELLSV